MSVKVKRLEWEVVNGNWKAKHPFGWFSIRNDEDGISAGMFTKDADYHFGFFRKSVDTIGAAKEECQAYFERLVLECLEVDNETN